MAVVAAVAVVVVVVAAAAAAVTVVVVVVVMVVVRVIYLQESFSKIVFVFICSSSMIIWLPMPHYFFMIKSQPIVCE